MKKFGIPSLFDICVILFLIILPLLNVERYPRELMQGIFLVFGTICLMCLGYMMRPRRNYESIPLALLAILSFIYLFWKNWYVGPFSRHWANWNLMNEGFLYVFFGIFLIKTIVCNAKSYGWYYIPIIGCVLYLIFGVGFNLAGATRCAWIEIAKGVDVWTALDRGWSMTPILAVLIGGGITLLRCQRWRRWAIVAWIWGINVSIYKWPYICQKWAVRPDMWKFMIKRIADSKFMGWGFYQTLNTQGGFVAPELKGSEQIMKRWAVGLSGGWRQNDFGEITEYLGVIALGIIICFIIRTLYKARPSIAYFLAVSSVVLCFFQRTIFHPVKAGIILAVIALLILEKKED